MQAAHLTLHCGLCDSSRAPHISKLNSFNPVVLTCIAILVTSASYFLAGYVIQKRVRVTGSLSIAMVFLSCPLERKREPFCPPGLLLKFVTVNSISAHVAYLVRVTSGKTNVK